MIITTNETYTILCNRMNSEPHIITPIFRDIHYHTAINTLLCVGVTFFDNTTHVVSISHKDALQFECPKGTAISYTPNTKEFNASVDITSLAYTHKIKIDALNSYYTPYINDSRITFYDIQDLNRVIPLTVWADVLSKYNTSLLSIVQLCEPNEWFHKMLTTFSRIESTGLAVNLNILATYFGEKVLRYAKDNIVYTQYNPYTSTGRPSNRFGGINFSALNKTDGSREAFISRYPNGCLVQFDFEAYHLRLIADHLNIELSTSQSIHKELAKKYYNTDEISIELYSESKKRTFEIMYGMSSETYGVELFEKMQVFRQSLWDEYQIRNRLLLPNGMSIVVDDASPNKVFNYYVQNLEIYKTIPKLHDILNFLDGRETKLILYTYDSILLDMPSLDISVLRSIRNILEEDKKFPVRAYLGSNYHLLTEITV